jgi:hypothetical protein
MVLTVSFGLSPGTGLSCPRHLRIIIRGLDASVGASGPHDFAVRAAVARLFDTITSIASRPAFRDDRDAPLLPGRDNADESTDLGSKARSFLKIRNNLLRQIGTTGNFRLSASNVVDDVHDAKPRAIWSGLSYYDLSGRSFGRRRMSGPGFADAAAKR